MTARKSGEGQDATEDLKAKMREALERKRGNDTGVDLRAAGREKAHGPEVVGGGMKMHRRKTGGGGA